MKTNFPSHYTFPPVELADEDGLLAMGGDLSPERLLAAYRNGIFPWYNPSDPILWWCPDPRFVLFPDRLHISVSMKKFLKKTPFTFTINKAFSQVIHHCRHTYRPDQLGTWITNEMENAYNTMHTLGYAHSAETWLGDKLVGGIYGIRLGNIFFGESMFSHETNASKFVLTHYMQQLQKEGVILMDCQVYSEHMESMGAEMISRKVFLEILKREIPQ